MYVCQKKHSNAMIFCGILVVSEAHASVFPFSLCLCLFSRPCSYCCCGFQVHLCEAEGLAEFLGEGAPLPEQDGRPVLVAVKQLRADATSNARFEGKETLKNRLGSCIRD